MALMGTIKPVSECFIKPKFIVEESKKPHYLGSFELLQFSQCHIQWGYLFDQLPSEEDGGMDSFLQRLKDSLSSTLALFYPLAGQFKTEVDEEEHNSFIFIDCNKGPGAKFIHAALDEMTVNDIVAPTIVPAIVQSFFELGRVPTNYDGHHEPLVSVQLTELVDGFFLGVSTNHCVVDGTSFWHFLSSWSEIFLTNDTKILRPPAILERWFPEGHGPIIKIPYTHPDEFITRYEMDKCDEKIREAIYHISAESLKSLKAKANEEAKATNKISSIQALSALLWRAIARSHRSQSDENCICAIVANLRPRLCPPLPEDYFSNFIDVVIKSTKAEDLLGKSLGWAASLLNQGVEELTDESVRDEFVKWIKSPFIPKAGKLEPNVTLIGGVPRFDLNKINFGLGKPIAMRTGSNKYDGKVTLNPWKDSSGDIALEVCLEDDIMNAFQQDTEFTSFLERRLY